MKPTRWGFHKLLGTITLISFLSITHSAVGAPLRPSHAVETTNAFPMLGTNALIAQEQRRYAVFVQTHPPDAYAYGVTVYDTWQRWRVNGSPNGYVGGAILVAWSTTMLTHGAYEAMVGRLFSRMAMQRYTPEDGWEAKMALTEAQAWSSAPWYEFSVWKPLHDLWINDSPTDVSFIRQLERRYAYTTGYALQGLSAALIQGVQHLLNKI